jgi:hypothetical protein
MFERRQDFAGERRELIIHNQRAVFADRDADVPAGAFKHVNIFCDVNGLDLDFGKILLGSGADREREQESARETFQEMHAHFLTIAAL